MTLFQSNEEKEIPAGEEIFITQHGKERIYERVQPKKRTPEELAEFVLQNGIGIEYTRGNLYRWIDKRRIKYKDTLCMLYQNHLYIYCKRKPHALITAFRLPKDLQRLADKLYKKKRKNTLGEIQ